jgi:hypothetical protein
MRAVFLRALGAVHVAAFASLAVQLRGLVGAHGILPAAPFLEGAFRQLGGLAVAQLPTLAWLSASDGALLAQAGAGVALGLALAAGVAPRACLVGLWVLYLSLSVVGQTFLYFQWDTLLLETTLVAALLAPAGLRPLSLGSRAPASEPVPAVARWLVWSLVFKLMFLSGITKLASGDPSWADGTALAFHYETQPIPAPTSWLAHQLPAPVQRASLAFMWLAELVAPFAALAPPRWRGARIAGCAVMVTLQIGIAATGSYGFFNLLTIVLCASLLDDDAWRRVLPRRWTHAPPVSGAVRAARSLAGLRTGVAVAIALLSALAFAREIAFTLPRAPGGSPPLAWTNPLVDWARPLRSVNGYGLFRVMTTERHEVAIEARREDGVWHELRFGWKPGDPARAPRFTGPHMPRLDWQMWFAALDPRRNERWLLSLARRLLEGRPEVRALLDDPWLDGAPPREVRFALFRYRFTRIGEGGDAWWVRERLGLLSEPILLDAFGPVAHRGGAAAGASWR